ncbi:MAG: MoaD/ThiS family protein [Candidatus Zipacnadales bacterium]
MAVIVRIPPYWRRFTDRKAEVMTEGETVGQVLANIGRQYPDLQERLFTNTGELATNVSLFLNRESVARQEGLQTPVAAGDVLMIVLAIAGG